MLSSSCVCTMPHPSQLAAHHLTLLGKTKNHDEPQWQSESPIIVTRLLANCWCGGEVAS